MTYSQRLIKQLASLKLAVVIIVILMILTAWGTFVEAKYDAAAARKLVYDTWMMYVALGMLATSLIAVMVDRWPWKPRHIPFLLAHVGILILLAGSVMTMKAGIDGSVVVPIGGQSSTVVLPHETDLLVYASFGGEGMAKLSEEEVDFFREPPTEEKPHRVKLQANETIDVVDYQKYVLPRRDVVASDDPVAVPAVRFQIQNARVSVIEWLVPRGVGRTASHDFGPAKIHLGPTPSAGLGMNEIYLTPEKDKIRWTMFRRDSDKPAAKGITEEGGVVETGWMGLQLRILRYVPRAREKVELEPRERPTELTQSAIKVRFRGKEHWLLLDDTLRLFTEDTAYLVSYNHRRLDLGFPLKLVDFKMIPYQGTNRAKEYMSRAIFPDLGEVPISMNEPAVHNGLTFYQASFHNDPQTGQPVASVFSVNRDPGRWWKYIGSLIICLGIVWLFWNKRKKRT